MSYNANFAGIVLRRLKRRYGNQMRTSLDHTNPWQLLVATILSAQTQDAQVNVVTPGLFRRFNGVDKFARSRPADLYPYIKSIGLYKGKARSIVGAARAIVEEHGGVVPKSIAELDRLPGVGRKTANVVLSNGFGINDGIAIDTHCTVVANRLGLTRSRHPEVIERDLMRVFDHNEWSNVSLLFIALGRDVCTKRAKHCEGCVLNDVCPSSTVRRDRARTR